MKFAYLALLLCMSGASFAVTPPADEDERWIERYMASAPPRQLKSTQDAGQLLRFDQLSSRVGDSIRVQLRDGRTRRGVLERADGRSAQLGMQINGGKFAFKIERDQVVQISAE